MEVLFRSPRLLNGIGEPKPYIGTTINTAGDTSFLYGGFMWDGDLCSDRNSGMDNIGARLHYRF